MTRTTLRLSVFAAIVLFASSVGSIAVARPAVIAHLVGSVTDNGVPVAGAGVTAGAWPNWKFLNLVAADQTFDLRELGSTTTDEMGQFTLDLDLQTLPGTYETADGTVEIEVTAFADSKVRVYFTTEPSANASSDVTIPPMDLAEGGVAPAALANAAAGAEPMAVATCSPHWINNSDNGPYQTKIMDVLAVGQVNGTGSYANGGSTSTTLGVLAQGAISGNWSASGSSTIGTSGTTGFQATPIKDKRLYGQFIYRKWIDGYCQTLNKPHHYYGRGNTLSISHPNYSACGGNYFNGDLYTHTHNNNQTYSNGLTVFGVGLSSHAGYVASASLKFNFNARGNVCGSNASLGETSPIVEASTQ
jgi:hypothetical protein